jgi:hypothetical protein
MTNSVNGTQSNVSNHQEPLTLTWSNLNVTFNKSKKLADFINRTEKKKISQYKADQDYTDQEEPIEFITKPDEPAKPEAPKRGFTQILNNSK